jgi:hypothetical protein
VALRDGDRIEIEALPADDPGLTSRMKQGIFLSCPAQGFLREVFYDPTTPPLTEDESFKLQILRRFLAKSESIIPWINTEIAAFVRMSADSVWGGRLEVSSGAATEGPWQLFDYQPAVQVRFTDGSASASHSFWLGRAIFVRSGEIWTGGDDFLASSTLDEVVRHVTSNQQKAITWGQWELLREGQEKPLAIFTPRKDVIPQIFLQGGDTIKLSTADAAAGWLPPQAQSDSAPGKENTLRWVYNGYGLTRSSTLPTAVPAGVPQPQRRRVVIPSPPQ